MRILHTMLRVGDLDRSIAFYTDVLGMTLVSRNDFPGGRFTLAFVGYEDGAVTSPSAARTPLIELTHNWDTPAYELGNGFGHMAVEVDDAYAMCEAIKARGGKVVGALRYPMETTDHSSFLVQAQSSKAKVVVADTAPEGAVATERDDLWLNVAQSAAAKCDRCWHHREDVGSHAEHPELCGRCISNLPEGPGEERRYA